MNSPEYCRPGTVSEALEYLASAHHQVHILAGGTDLVIMMRRGRIHPEAIMDITRLSELRGIYQSNGNIHIGALTTHGELRNSKDIAGWAPMFIDACRDVGSVQIRNLGTLGGNLGNASPAGDTIPVLYVLGAEVLLKSLSASRWVPIEKFFTAPGKTVRQPDEMIIEVRFPVPEGEWKGFFQKIGQRKAMRISKVSAAGWLCFKNNHITECRLALGAVAPTVIRLLDTEEILKGKPLSRGSIQTAAASASASCSPISDIRSTLEFRRAMAGVLVKRGLEKIMHEVKNV